MSVGEPGPGGGAEVSDRRLGLAVVAVVAVVAVLVAGTSIVAGLGFRSDARRWESAAASADAEAAELERDVSRLQDDISALSDEISALQDELQAQAEPEPPVDEGGLPSLERALTGPPRVVDGLILLVNVHAVGAADRATGEPRWTLTCEGAEWLSPLPSGDPFLEVARCGDELVGIDVVAGVRRWVSPLPFDPDRSRVGSASVVMQEDLAGVVVLDLGTGDERWRALDAGAANVAVTPGRIYFSNDDGVFAHDEATGAELWRFPIATRGLIATPDAVFARTALQQVHRLDPATGASIALSAADLAGFNNSDFVAVTANVVVLRQANAQSVVSVFDATTAQLLWQHHPAGTVGVAATSDVISIFDSTGALTTYDVRSGAERERVPNALDLLFGTVNVVGLAPGNPDGWARLLTSLLK